MEAVLNKTFPEKNSSTNREVAEELHASSNQDVAAINYSVTFTCSAEIMQTGGRRALGLHVDRNVYAHSHPLQDPIKNIIQRPT